MRRQHDHGRFHSSNQVLCKPVAGLDGAVQPIGVDIGAARSEPIGNGTGIQAGRQGKELPGGAQAFFAGFMKDRVVAIMERRQCVGSIAVHSGPCGRGQANQCGEA